MSTITSDEDQLERHSKNPLSEPEQRSCEEHLLICEACRNALEETETYVSAMRAAERLSNFGAMSDWGQQRGKKGLDRNPVQGHSMSVDV